MDSKKEVIVASILAVSLAVGLATMSFGLFSETPAAAKLESALDVFTQKGGLGINVSNGNFEPLDDVSVYAYLTQGGVKLENHAVTFTVTSPDGTQASRTASTNDLGLAEADVSLLPSEGHVTGTWHIFANATVDNEAVNDALDFECKSQSARIDLFSEKNGVLSISFLPDDLVLLEAQLLYRNASIAGTPVTFDVKSPNGTELPLPPVTTDSLGTANVTFRIPWPSDYSSLGTWRASAASEVYGQKLNASTDFECSLLPSVVDVFTQKGGFGPNTPGGNFVLNGTVALYAEVRNELNQSVPNLTVGFLIRDPNGTDFVYLANSTDLSGIANITIRVPDDTAYVGTFEVYARTRYYDMVLLDTLTFTAKQD